MDNNNCKRMSTMPLVHLCELNSATRLPMCHTKNLCNCMQITYRGIKLLTVYLGATSHNYTTTTKWKPQWRMTGHTAPFISAAPCSYLTVAGIKCNVDGDQYATIYKPFWVTDYCSNTTAQQLTSGKWPCRYLTVRELFPTPPLPTTQMVSLFSELG